MILFKPVRSKAVEEAIKIIAVRGNLVKAKDRWKSELLFEAARKTGNKEIVEILLIAWELHVDGFHEMKLTSNRLFEVKDKIRRILNYV
ncbi:PaREP1 family protein [Acidianus ambivalens]|uniref:PaREP1 family protein n=1 Tax=Acidianus ambivalens TaxID=2283 RepID=UPI001E2E9103|nr:PaREP1 family protein [Acidianus ambivalens]